MQSIEMDDNLSDRVFFPLMLLAAISMVFVAARRPAPTCPSGSVSVSNTYYKVIPLTGHQLNRFVTNEHVQKTDCNLETDYVLALTTAANKIYPESPDIGPHFRLAPDIESVFSGNQIKLLIEARSREKDASFEVNYFAGPEGSSGWKRYELNQTYQQYIFDYRVPTASQDSGVDFLGIRPTGTHSDTTIEIRDLTFLTLGLMSKDERDDALAKFVKP